MKSVSLIIPAVVFLFLAACENTESYPVSGEECGPDDAVKTLDAADCALATPVATGF